MEDLLETVISALQPTDLGISSRDPLEIASEEREFYLEDAEKALLWGIEEISQNPPSAWRVASLVAALSVHFPSSLSSNSRKAILLFDAMELSQNPTSEKAEEMIFLLRSELWKVRREIQRQKRKLFVGNASRSVVFLADFFEDLAAELHLVGGVSRETARRWIGGGGISSERTEKIVAWAGAFYMLLEMGENPIVWWHAPLPRGKSPRDYFIEDWLLAPPPLLRMEISCIQQEFKRGASS